MRYLVFSSILFSIHLTAFCQTSCPSCDAYLDVIYDVTHIKKNDNFNASFKSWFFSEDFKKDVQNSNTGLSVTIPIDGVPITFGGNHESAGAWETYNKNMNSTKWDFSKVSEEEIFKKVATTDSRQTWLACIYSSCNTRFPLRYTQQTSDVIVTFGYDANLIDGEPIITGFTCGGGLDCSVANKLYKNKKLQKGAGQSAKFKWKPNDEDEGSITLNTTKGSSITLGFKRSIPANQAVAVYTTMKMGDSSLSSESVLETKYTGSTVIMGFPNHGVRPVPGWLELDPTGQWCAMLTPIRVGPSPQHYFRNFRFDYSPGAWYDVKDSQKDGPVVGVTYRCWGPTPTVSYTCDVYKAIPIYHRDTVAVPVASNHFSISIPKSAITPLITVYQTNSKSFTFDPSGILPDNIILDSTDTDGNNVKYNYSIKK